MDMLANYQLASKNKIPVMGLGTWQLKPNTEETVLIALGLGYRMLNTSREYGNQADIGEAIKISVVNREDVYLIATIEETDEAYEAALSNIETLGVDYVDLTLIHRPPLYGAGEELWEGLMRAKKEGLTKDIGVSNYSVRLIKKLVESTGEMPAVNQIEWSPFGFSLEMKKFCDENGIIIQAHCPLTRGKRLDNPILIDLATIYGKTPAQMLLRWNLQHKIIPLAKAAHADHLIENIDIFDFVITAEDMDVLDSLNENYSALGSPLYE